nr:hypothetical protein [uncultured Allomuricauda sp.]
MKIVIFIISLLLSLSCLGQSIQFKLDGEEEKTNKYLIIFFNDGTFQSERVESFKTEEIDLKQELKKVSSIKLKLDLDTLGLKDRPPALAVFGLDPEGMDKLAKDTLLVRKDIFPFQYSRTGDIISTESFDELVDHDKMTFYLINDDSYVIHFPEFDMEKHSEHYSDLIKDDVCNCMKNKEFDKDNFKETFESCLEKPMTDIIPSMDFVLKNYVKKTEMDIQTSADNLVHSVLKKVNLFYNANCFKK